MVNIKIVMLTIGLTVTVAPHCNHPQIDVVQVLMIVLTPQADAVQQALASPSCFFAHNEIEQRLNSYVADMICEDNQKGNA